MSKRIIKRVLGLILSLCMVISTVFTGRITVKAETIPERVNKAITNPGFEEVQEGKIPGWTQIFGTAGITVADEVKYSGNNSIKIVDNSTDTVGTISDAVPVTAGHEYIASAMVYLENTGNAEIYLRFFDKDGKLAGNFNKSLASPIGQWQSISVSAVAPAGAVDAAILFYSSKNNKGTFYFDDASLKRKMAVKNAGFESPVTGGIIPGWDRATTGYSDKFQVTNAKAYSGSYSLFLEKDAAKSNFVQSEGVTAKPGATYTITAKVNIDYNPASAACFMYARIHDSADKGTSVGNTKFGGTMGEWITYTIEFKAPTNAKKLRIAFDGGANKSYKYYVDDVLILTDMLLADDESTPSPDPTPEPNPVVKTEVQNPGFEEALINGTIPGWKKDGASSSDNFAVTTEKSFSGTSSLRIENEPGKYMNVLSDLIAVDPGQIYTLKAKAFLDYGSVDMYIRFFDDNGKYTGEQKWNIVKEPTNTWFDHMITFTVPANIKTVGILFAGGNNKVYKYYVDDVALVKGEVIPSEPPIPENSIIKVGQDLGVQVRKATIMLGDFGKDASGRDVIYTVVAGAPSKLAVVDVKSEKLLKSIELPDTSGAWAVKVAKDGTIYLGAYNKGLLFRYLPQTEQLINLGYPIATNDAVLYPMADGKDGKIYGGAYSSGAVYEYDPVTNKFTSFGRMAEGQSWVRTVAYDEETHKVYAGVGSVAHLIEYDIATGTKTNILPPQYSDITSVYDLNLVDGKLFARKENGTPELPYAMFVIDVKTKQVISAKNAQTGEYVQDIPASSRGVSPKSPIANKIYYTDAGILCSYNLDTDTFENLGINVAGSAIGYEFLQLEEEGFPGYTLVGLSGNSGKMFKYNLETGNLKLVDLVLPAEPVLIHEVAKGPDGKIYSSGYLPGNIAAYTPSTGVSKWFDGIGQAEGLTYIGNKLYLGLYPKAKIYEYDLTKPWDRSDSTKLNPNTIFSLEYNSEIPGYTDQDRPFAMLGVEEYNKLFIGTVPKNGLLGGVFAIYDVEKGGTPEVHWNIVQDQSIVSLAYSNGMVFGGSSIAGGQGSTPTATSAKLFVWDVEKNEKIFEIVPAPGKKAITDLTIGSDGNVWGMANGVLFIFNPVEKQIIYSEEKFPEAANNWREARLEVGTDGNVYGVIAGKFFKVDASTKTHTVLATQVNRFAQDDFGNFYLSNGNILYKYADQSLVAKLAGAEISIADNSSEVTVKGLLERGRETYDLEGAVIEYFSSNPEVATVENGMLKRHKEGNAEIWAEVTLGGIKVTSNKLNMTNSKFEIGIPAFTDNLGNPVADLVPSTEIRSSVRIVSRNSEASNVTLIVALYNPQGAMRAVSTDSKKLEPGQVETLSAGFTLPEDVDGYKVKAFVWDSLNGLKPLSGVTVLED